MSSRSKWSRWVKDRLGIMIADVSGKGIPAALFMALSRIVVRVNATWYGKRPAAAIRDANTIIANDSKSGMFVTLFYGFLDSATRTLTYVNAGHNPPIHFRAADGTLEELPATGIAMGALDDAAYTQETVQMDRAMSWCCTRTGSRKRRMQTLRCSALNGWKKLSLHPADYLQTRSARRSSTQSRPLPGITRSRMISR